MTKGYLFLLLPLRAACASAKERAAADDATCQGYGAKPGSDAYVQCRMVQDARRDQRRREIGDSLQQAGQALRDPPRQSIDCRSSTFGRRWVRQSHRISKAPGQILIRFRRRRRPRQRRNLRNIVGKRRPSRSVPIRVDRRQAMLVDSVRHPLVHITAARIRTITTCTSPL
jgi:hypothetical protein